MSLRIYNTITGKKEKFIPLDIENKKVGMYVCGVTVYNDCHIGHARNALTFDVIKRYLEYLGYNVTYVRNITDIDDKIIEAANTDNISIQELTNKYILSYYEDMNALNISKPDYEPRATQHIPQIINLIEKLINKNYAYNTDGGVYFDVRKFNNYGELSKCKVNDMISNPDEYKKYPLDFVLWKAVKPNEPYWDSPWGKGRPGWHIECSAMSIHYLGESFDIHGGGKDLIFPHHENEIAQSEAAYDSKFAKYWIHNGFVQVNKEKMSKSLNNFFTIKDILSKYSPEVLRLFLLSTHYRNPISFSYKQLEKAKSGLERFYNIFIKCEQTSVDKNYFNTYKTAFENAMNDDFNTPMAIGILFNLVRAINKLISCNAQQELIQSGINLVKKLGNVLGLFSTNTALPIKKIEQLINERNEARINKDWIEADRIREKLLKLGVILKDYPDRTNWIIKFN